MNTGQSTYDGYRYTSEIIRDAIVVYADSDRIIVMSRTF